MKSGIRKTAVVKLALLITIALMSTMSAGCMRVMETAIGIDREQIQNDVLAQMGIMDEPPQVSTLTSYDTSDPDIQIFLSYINALNNGVEGVAGKDMDIEDSEELLRVTEEDVRKSGLGGSADQNLAMAEKMTDSMRKGTFKYLSLLPDGADQRKSSLTSSAILYPDPDNNGELDLRSTAITVIYAVKTPEEVSQKTRELLDKLKPVFAGKKGWTAIDLPSGGLVVSYQYKSQHRLQSNVGNINAIDSFIVNLVPKSDLTHGYNQVCLVFTTGIAEPRKKM